MISITDERVVAALNGSHKMVPRVTAYYGGVAIGEVPIIDGSVTFDEGNPILGRCSLRIPVTTFPSPNDFDVRELDVSGWRLFIEYGVVLYDVTYYVPLGTFVCYDMDDDDTRIGRVLSITGYDTTVLLRDGRFEAPYSIAAGTTYNEALTDLASAINLPSSFPVTGYTTPLLLFVEGDDRFAKMSDMATSVGWNIVADENGTITAVSASTTATSEVAREFVEGQGSAMTSLSRHRTRQQVYNIAVVTGEPADGSPVYGIAYDQDPNSPTYYLGPFGRVPVFEKSQYVTTTDQANAAAFALLSRKIGIGSALQITSWPNPTLRPGDAVRVKRDRMGIDQVIPLRSNTVPLTPGDEGSFVTREGFVG